MKDKFYYKDGGVLDYYDIHQILHRIDGPAVECSDRYKAWWVDGKRHKEDGPAVEFANGSKAWWVNGKRHREDGPAIEYEDGDKYWYINDKLLTEEQFHNHPQVRRYRFQVLLEEVLSETS